MKNRALEGVVPKRKDAVVRHLGDEVLVYDEERNKAHCLNQTAAEVFALCDGERSVKELIGALEEKSISPKMVELALARLAKAGLLSAPLPFRSGVDLSRRALVRKLGAAAAIALPIVVSVMVPTAAQAVSPCLANGQLCSNDADCCSGNCGILIVDLICLP